MYTRALMSVSAAFTAVVGLAMSFIPQELLRYQGLIPETTTVVLVQVTGALYLAFAMLNWLSRGNIIGGIYARPLTLANFLHFAVVAIVLVKYLMAGFSMKLVAIVVPYVIIAGWFALVLFTAPAAVTRNSRNG